MTASPLHDEPETQHQPPAHPLDAYIADPAQHRPLCDEALFASVLHRMVADNAPRLFAIVAEYGNRVDAAIAAWGLAFDNRAEIICAEHDLRISMPTPHEALAAFSFGAHIHARLVWYDPDNATPAEDDTDELTHTGFEI